MSPENQQPPEEDPKDPDPQGRLFGTHNDFKSGRTHYDPEPIPGELSEDREGNIEENKTTASEIFDSLHLLQAVTSDIAQANMRDGFVNGADPQSIAKQAERKRKAPRDAVGTANNNKKEFETSAKESYQELQRRVSLGLGLMAAMGAGFNGKRPKTYREFKESVIGAKNKKFRAKVVEANEWEKEFTNELITTSVVETEAAERAEETERTKLLRLITRFRSNKDLSERIREYPKSISKFSGLLPQADGSKCLTEGQQRALIKNPSGWAYSVGNEGGVSNKAEKQNAFGRVFYYQKSLIEGLSEDVETLRDARNVVNGEHSSDSETALDIMINAKQIILDEAKLVATKVLGYDHKGQKDEIDKYVQEIWSALVPENYTNSSGKKQMWHDILTICINHKEAVKHLFEDNTKALEKEYQRYYEKGLV